MRDLLRNGLLMAVARFPQNLVIRLLHMVPLLIALVCAYFFSAAYAVMGLFLYYILLGFSMSRFVTASFTNAVFDKYINSHIEGAVVNRGLNQEADDDDDDDDEDDNQPQA